MDSPGPLSSVVVLAISDRELLALTALMLEIAGFRSLPLSDLSQFDVSTRDIALRAVVVDARGGDASTWLAVRQIQATSGVEAAQILVIAASSNDVPVAVVEDGARILKWPFPLTDVLSVLEER